MTGLKLNAVFYSGIIVFFFGLMFSCNEPSVLGSEFVDDDDISLEITEDFDIDVKTIVREPIRIYSSRRSLLNTYLVGNIDDPYLGKTSAEVYSQLTFLSEDNNPFRDARIDSMLFILEYDTFGLYGNLEEEVTLKVSVLDAPLSKSEEYFSNQQFPGRVDPIIEHTFVPKPYDSVRVVINDSTDELRSARLRIPIDTNKRFQDLFVNLDSALWAQPDSFSEQLFGLKLELESNNTMLGFNLDAGQNSRLVVYYTIGDSLSTTFAFRMDEGAAKSAYYHHDYQGSLLGDILADSMSGLPDTLTFLQEMQGVNPTISIRNLAPLSGKAINSAIVEMTLAELPNDNLMWYPHVELLTAERGQGDTTFIRIKDTDAAINDLAGVPFSFDAYRLAFGGFVEEVVKNGETKSVYRINITSAIQDAVIRGDDEFALVVNSILRPESPRRAIISGNNSNFPVKLKVIYTDIK